MFSKLPFKYTETVDSDWEHLHLPVWDWECWELCTGMIVSHRLRKNIPKLYKPSFHGCCGWSLRAKSPWPSYLVKADMKTTTQPDSEHREMLLHILVSWWTKSFWRWTFSSVSLGKMHLGWRVCLWFQTVENIHVPHAQRYDSIYMLLR